MTQDPKHANDDDVGGAEEQEKVEDRPSVSTVTPSDYPAKDREESQP
jgi:hypothetical protein